jgi:hypothetical protein
MFPIGIVLAQSWCSTSSSREDYAILAANPNARQVPPALVNVGSWVASAENLAAANVGFVSI